VTPAPAWACGDQFSSSDITDTLPDLYIMDICDGAQTKVASGVIGYADWRPGAALETVPTVIATPPDTGEAAAKTDFARKLACGPRVALALMKQNFNAAENGTLTELLDLEARRQIETGKTEDHKEAARAFVEKRAPVFVGR